MSTHIKTFSDKTYIEFDKGRFDDWCIYYVDNRRVAPTDIGYFTKLKNLAKTHGKQKVYDDFVQIYNATTANINSKVLNNIASMASSYGSDSLEAEKLFTILYAGMIAEENKNKAILKKKIKRLGMYQLLIDDFTPHQAANFSKGKNCRELMSECKNRNF